jgi:hypothetical protein
VIDNIYFYTIFRGAEMLSNTPKPEWAELLSRDIAELRRDLHTLAPIVNIKVGLLEDIAKDQEFRIRKLEEASHKISGKGAVIAAIAAVVLSGLFSFILKYLTREEPPPIKAVPAYDSRERLTVPRSTTE